MLAEKEGEGVGRGNEEMNCSPRSGPTNRSDGLDDLLCQFERMPTTGHRLCARARAWQQCEQSTGTERGPVNISLNISGDVMGQADGNDQVRVRAIELGQRRHQTRPVGIGGAIVCRPNMPPHRPLL